MKSLIFNTEDVLAWKAGSKKLHFVKMRKQPDSHSWEFIKSHQLMFAMFEADCGLFCKFWHKIDENPNSDGGELIRAPFRPGEKVYIRETWQGTKDCLSYKASDPCQVVEFGYEPWRSPVTMPEWAARFHAIIKSVAPMQIQSVTTSECVQYGLDWTDPMQLVDDAGDDEIRERFANLYSDNHWDNNEWVWRTELQNTKGCL